MRAILFPGQGSQFVGMGSDFYKSFEVVKKNFEIVDNTLGYSLSKIILEGSSTDLNLTKNTQPAIMVIGVSIFNVLNNEFNYDLNKSEFFAGHSLGEYTALVCSGSLSLERAAYLLHERGKAMQSAVPVGQGSMLAILGMTIDEVEKEVNLVKKNEVCEIANDNSDTQVVVSGTKRAIEILNENIKKKKKKGIMLSVSAPFHSSLMKNAAENMRDKLEKTNFLTPQPRVISNVTSKEYGSKDNIKTLLVEQIVSRVRWRESINYMIEKGIIEFLEIGPGKVLSGLVKKINNNVKISNINSINDIKK
tara:strand:- start:9093 stop:10010 length:918 start_codon:yes stop_codon:yes gene_type:complete